jgi:hypothetical protein
MEILITSVNQFSHAEHASPTPPLSEGVPDDENKVFLVVIITIPYNSPKGNHIPAQGNALGYNESTILSTLKGLHNFFKIDYDSLSGNVDS